MMEDNPKYRLEQMPCGGTPVFDVESGISYRCDVCFAVVGSIGQPRGCVEMNKGINAGNCQERDNRE